MAVTVLIYLLVILSVAFIAGAIFKYFNQPPVVGYLLAGFILGIFFKGAYDNETVRFFSELGVVLLLFTLGLEFSFNRLKKVAHVAIWGGVIQILATVGLGAFFITFLGIDSYSALFAAAAFSLSSTAIVVKLLTDRGELDSLAGEIMIGWLVVQDLAVLPMIILLPVLANYFGVNTGHAVGAESLIQSIGYAIGVLTIVLVVGKQIMPFVIKKIVDLNSRELLLVAVFSIAVASALFTQALGLSAAIGAFLAGLLIAESAQMHAIFSEMRPLRDLFSLIFFATLGLVIPSGFLFSHIELILIIVVVMMTLKFLLALFLTVYLGYHAKTSFFVGVGLIEMGEFAFILASIGLSDGLISNETYALILSVSLISILIMPPIYLAAPTLYVKLRKLFRKSIPPVYLKFFQKLEHSKTMKELPFEDHVVVCGYGRVGRYVVRALEMMEVPFVVIEYNDHKARRLRHKGYEVVYGDPSDIDILDYAQVDKAKAIVIAIPDYHTQKMVIANSVKLKKNIHIYCRTHQESHQKLLKSLGAQIIIQPEFEASLSIVNKILKEFGAKNGSIEKKVTRLKIEHGLA